MKGLFNVDNPFFRFMSKTFDIIWLNVMWVVSCLLVVTIAPATTAMYYAIAKCIRRERSYVTKEYFKSLKKNFLPGIFVTLFGMVAAYLMYVDFQFAWNMVSEGETTGSILLGIFFIISYLIIATLIYSFAILSRFELKFLPLLKFSVVIACKHMGYTFLMVLTVLAGILGCYLLVPGILVFPSLVLLIISYMMEKILKKYTPVPEGTEEELGIDLWYLE